MMTWLSSIGPAVGNHLWQSTAFAGAVWVVTLLLRRNQARVRYGLWLAASMKFLVPFSLLVGLGSLLPRPQHAVVAMPVYSAMDAAAQPFMDLRVEAAPPIVHPSPMQQFVHALPAVLAGAWLCGVGVVLAVWGMRWRQVAKTLRQAGRAEDGREWEALLRLQGVIGARRQIPLLMSQELMEPGIFGISRLFLIWPERLSERLDDEHIEAILAHELMHARRRDNLTAALHMVVEAAFWFHPAVWWMERRMVEERERACDEAVVEMGSKPEIYAESLLKACRFCVESPMVCVAGITGADLNRRVRSIMALRLEKLGIGGKASLAILGLLAIAAPVAFGIMHMIPPYAQVLHATGPRPSFEVASIHVLKRPAPPPSMVGGEHVIRQQVMKFSPGGEGDQTSDRVHIIAPLGLLIARAYGLPPGSDGRGDGRVVGGPDWMDGDPYDIQAKIDEQEYAAMQKMTSEQQREQVYLMTQSLLEDRFKLKVHFETRELPAYALVVAKGGPKLTQANDGESTKLSSTRRGQSTEMSATASTLAQFVDSSMLSAGTSGRTVVDQTGLNGKYDFTLKWGAESPAGQEPSDEPSLFTAIQEQLGLKLVPTKGRVEVIVIDSAEKPSVDGAEVTQPAMSLGSLAMMQEKPTQAGAQSAPANAAGNIAATWQGTLHAARDQRFVFKITEADDGTLRATFYNIDGGPGGIPVISTRLNGSLLKLDLNFGIYEGTVSADGNSIRGTWRQGPNPLPLNLARATTETEWTIPQPPPRIPPMATDANPTFEVATIKPSRPDEHGPRYDFQSRRFSVVHASLSDLLKFSYGLQQSQITKAKDWVNSENYDIAAEPDGEGEPSIKQWQSMVKKLMADRFQLKFHFEKRELAVYALTVAKAGPKLNRSQGDPSGVPGLGFGPGNFGATNATMADIAEAMQQGALDRPVVDQTGLTGRFDLSLRWTPDEMHSATESADAPPDLFTAIQQQLGLKLESTKAPVDVLVIDHIEKPSEN